MFYIFFDKTVVDTLDYPRNPFLLDPYKVLIKAFNLCLI